MSYDVYFLKRAPGQSYKDTLEALEELAARGERPEDDAALARPAHWDQIVSGVREVLGDVSVLEGPPNWEITDEKTAIQLSCFAGEWSMTVPYWWDGERAQEIAGYLHAIAVIVHEATGLDAYDPQVEQEVTSDEWVSANVTAVFNQVAEDFRQQGIR